MSDLLYIWPCGIAHDYDPFKCLYRMRWWIKEGLARYNVYRTYITRTMTLELDVF